MLGIDQATVSRRVALLERRAGTPLFSRRTTGAEATDLGRELIVAAEEAAQAMQRFERLLQAARPPSVVSVSAPEGIATYFLGPHLLRSAPASLPPLRIVPLGAPAEIQVVLDVHGEIPVGSDHRLRRAGSMKFTAVAGRDYLAERGMPERLSDLRRHDLLHHVVYDHHPAFGAWADTLHSAPQPPLLIASTSSGLHRSMISAGGITLLPDFSPLIDPAAVCVSCGLPDMSVEVYVTAHPDHLRHPSVRKAFDAMTHLFARSPWFQR